MLYKRAESNEMPQAVRLETLPDGKRRVEMVKDIREEGEGEEKKFVFDQLDFILPDDRTDIQEAADVLADFEGWWDYGSQEEEPVTLEQRVEMLEEIVTELL